MSEYSVRLAWTEHLDGTKRLCVPSICSSASPEHEECTRGLCVRLPSWIQTTRNGIFGFSVSKSPGSARLCAVRGVFSSAFSLRVDCCGAIWTGRARASDLHKTGINFNKGEKGVGEE